jgi:hypothetical protein
VPTANALPRGKRPAATRSTTTIVLAIFGLRAAGVTVGDGGATIIATLTAATACTATPHVQLQIATRLRKTLPWVQSVRFAVAGTTGGLLGAYLRDHCAGLTLPAGHGRAVLTQRGNGFMTTTPFVIRSKRWTIEYVNRGSFLEIIPVKGPVPTSGAATLTKIGSGRKVERGPGRFRLQINGMGDWEVRVRNGA